MEVGRACVRDLDDTIARDLLFTWKTRLLKDNYLGGGGGAQRLRKYRVRERADNAPQSAQFFPCGRTTFMPAIAASFINYGTGNNGRRCRQQRGV